MADDEASVSETPGRYERLREVLAATKGRGPDGILVLTHQSPDPDALGALVGLRFLLTQGFGREARIATLGRIRRAENAAMVRELELAFDDYAEVDRSQFCAALLVDTQPGFGHTVVPDDLPLLGVFDHHEPQEPAAEWVHDYPHPDVRPGVGATSSMIYEYIRDACLRLDRHTATSLFCGIRFDTADLSTGASPLDEEAYYETLRFADKPQLARIQRPALPVDYYRELARSLGIARRYGPLVLSLQGRVANPESVAEMADFYLRMEDCHWSVVGGAHGRAYLLSLRTLLDFRPALPLMEKLFAGAGSYGGHGRIAGGRFELGEGGADDEPAIRRLERQLKARALRLLGTHGVYGPDARVGKPLT